MKEWGTMGIIDKVCGKIGLMDTEEELSEREDEITKENRDMNEKEFNKFVDIFFQEEL